MFDEHPALNTAIESVAKELNNPIIMSDLKAKIKDALFKSYCKGQDDGREEGKGLGLEEAYEDGWQAGRDSIGDSDE